MIFKLRIIYKNFNKRIFRYKIQFDINRQKLDYNINFLQ